MHPATPPPVPTPRSKNPVWVWVLAGFGAAFTLIALIAFVTGIFLVSKVAEVAQNPAQLGKILTQANPDLELIDTDREKKTIRVRDKKSGETVTIALEDLMNGKITLSHEGPEGNDTVELGGKLRLPNWVPKFPDVTPTSLGSAQSDREGEGGIFTFTTAVSEEKIRAFYQDGLERRGLEVKAQAGPALVMQSEDGKLHVTVNVETAGNEQRVTVAYGEKK